MKTITDLRNELLEVFEDLKDGNVEPKVAAEMNNAAGKAINTVKVQLEYAVLRKEIPKIAFLS